MSSCTFACLINFRIEGHSDLAERLNECQFELTDRLAHFLCGRKPGRNEYYYLLT